MLYGWAAREAGRRGWDKIITYTRADEAGDSLVAAGWERETTVRGRGWHSARRSRSNVNGWIDKVRWGKRLPARRMPRKETRLAVHPRRDDCLSDGLFGFSDNAPDFLTP